MRNTDTYFVRHSSFPGPIVKQLYDNNEFGLHYMDYESWNPDDYASRGAKIAFKRFNELIDEGGYIWSEYSPLRKVKVGYVQPGTNPRVRRYSREDRNGATSIIKTLEFSRSKKVPKNELLSLRAVRPRSGTLYRWPKAKQRVEHFVEGINLPLTWENLAPPQQETACTEFLREHSEKQLPKLRMLLLPPGRTMPEIDIYGISTNGDQIFAQVTNLKKERRTAMNKAKVLSSYPGHRLFFCDCEELHHSDDSDEIWFVPNRKVGEWLADNREYTEMFMQS